MGKRKGSVGRGGVVKGGIERRGRERKRVMEGKREGSNYSYCEIFIDKWRKGAEGMGSEGRGKGC